MEIILGEHELRGLGVRFAPFAPGDAWRLRVTNRAYGHQTYAPSGHFSVGSEPYVIEGAGDNVIEYRPPDNPAVLRIHGAEGPTVKSRTRTRPELHTPEWARGYWLGGTWVGITADKVRRDLEDALAARLDFKGRMIDAGWYGFDGDLFDLNRNFTDLAQLVEDHLSVGWNVSLWVAPWVPHDSLQWAEMNRRGWLVTDTSGEVLVFPVVGDGGITGSYLDLSAADVADAWAEAVARLCALGIRSIKLDFGEALPDSAHLKGDAGVPPGPEHRKRNWYPVYAQRATRAGLGNDGFLMSRSGWTGSEGITANWVGDQSSDGSRFSGLGSTVWALQSAFDSGYRSIGMDIGGYFGTPSESSMISWQRTALLFDFSLYHGLGERAPWRLGSAVAAAHQRCAERSSMIEHSSASRNRVHLGLTPSGEAIAQRGTDQHQFVADLARPMAFEAPAESGQWREVDSGQVVTAGEIRPCAPGSLFIQD